ncbi:hypothetical protein [Cognatilysobacter terrigena]|uniref:hypothetical protein n=1 Tax=Cognatilysobacter terrigena TaxID=2488749 RepID=UPI00105E0DAB|nr:hypothetical protein [Lysobacter terrigena]
MTRRNDILEKIREAMIFACAQSERFTSSKSETLAAEYIFTVSVAMAIAELNGPPGEPYVIRLERDAKTFKKDCVLPVKFGKWNDRSEKRFLRADDPTIDRPGRVDVTVYSDLPNSGYFGLQPICAIELKGFDPAANVIEADLKRNLEFLRTTGPTGDSVLEFTVFCALHSYKRLEDAQMDRNLQALRDRYADYVSALGALADIDVDVTVRTISSEQVGTVIEGPDYAELDDSSRHHFAGAIVVFSRAS